MNRGVAQLSRLDIGYSLLSGASKGVREFVASPLMKQFQAQHPHVKFVAQVNNRGFPHAEATYRQSHRDTHNITPLSASNSCHPLPSASLCLLLPLLLLPLLLLLLP
jgi:hypothetical protein